MPSITSVASLRSSHSSLSSCSDLSVDTNFSDRQEDFGTPTACPQDQNCNLVVEGEEYCKVTDETNAEFWLPPEPEGPEDDIIGGVAYYDDDDDECGDGVISKFGEESSVRYKCKLERIKAMNGVRNGKFRALVAHLLKSVGIIDSRGIDGESWVDIVTTLSWEAASFVKPDANEGNSMDPDGSVKVKCVASGLRSQSKVIKGLVFKKHAAHKHMPTKYQNPRLLLIHGSLDMSSDGLLSFQSMQQEKDNLNSIVEMIEACHPNVVLVEKTVSRDVQEFILAKGLTLVFDMKLHRLERVGRCIGMPILSPGIALGQKLRQCDSFEITRFVEDHAVSSEAGKKQHKTLMFLEGCPNRLGCTILLMGANSDELKRIKCAVRCAVVMAYHLMLETSFLLDQCAMFSTVTRKQAASLVTSSGEDSHVEKLALCTFGISASNGFQKIGSQNLPASYRSNKPATFLDLSLSSSTQKVVNDTVPIISDTFENVDAKYEFWISNCQDIKDQHDKNKKLEDDEESLLNNYGAEDHTLNKADIRTVLDSESILVLMSSRNASKGTVCEQSHFSHIKFYRSFDFPLGKFLRDNLLNQRLECKTCGESPEVHVFHYAHHNKQLTIQVRQLPARNSLPGEAEGRLWMWSRCSHCDGMSAESTKRILMSTGACELSFGKFLELSFSNHPSFCNPSSCNLSFQQDYLYFFGLGSKVAMFKYSPIATYTVTLPPQRMEFNSSFRAEFMKKEYENVYSTGISMFLDIEKSLKEIETRYVGVVLNIQGSRQAFPFVVEMLRQERSRFEVDFRDALTGESHIDVVCNALSLNRLRLELLLESCIWDRRLHALLSSNLKAVDMVETDSVGSQMQDYPLQLGGTAELEFHDKFSTKEQLVNELIAREVDSSSEDAREHHVLMLSNLENDKGWIWAPFTDIRREYMEDLQRGYFPKIASFGSFAAESVAQKLITDEGSRLHLPLGSNDYIVSDYEDEFSSIIACALTLLKDAVIATEELSRDAKSSDNLMRVFSFTSHWSSFGSSDSDGTNSPHTILEDSQSSFDGLDLLDSLVSSSATHPEVSMGLGKYPAKRKYSIVCLYAAQFRQLRDRFCPFEINFIASLSRCKNWDAKGGKSNSAFAKTIDDRFIIKEIKRTEFDSFTKFATNYFDYMNQCHELGNQTCLAKILGIYQVVIRGNKSGKEGRHDLIVMENLSFGQHLSRQYDLKGALHARFNTTSSNPEDVLLDQNFVNDMNESPLYVSRKSKRNLQRAIYNDTNFLNSINVMDYSLLVGVDVHHQELACGIIDYLRQYTWDKQLENWVKSSLVPKNQLPTIISPKEYKKRFRKFINTYFLSVPEHWCSQRSSNPCKLCGLSLENGRSHKKPQKRGIQEEHSLYTSCQKQGKHEAGSFKSWNNGNQNGFVV